MSRVTQRQVAQEAAVSLSTVSAVLSGQADLRRIAPETASRVWEVSRQIGYQATRPKKNLTHAVGVILRSRVANFLGNPFYGDVFQWIEETVEDLGFHLVFSSRVESILQSGGVPRMLVQRRVDGLILLGQLEAPLIERLLAFAVPAVCVNFEAGPNLTCVIRDGVEEARLAMEHVLALGHTRVAYLTSGLGSQHSRSREEGYRRCLPQGTRPIVLRGEGGDVEHGQAAMTEHLAAHDGQPSFRCLVAENDLLAVGAIRALGHAGFRVPYDISVVGGGGVTVPHWNGPRLTTTVVDRATMGRMAARLLVGTIQEDAGPVRVVLPSRLVAGETTTAPRPPERVPAAAGAALTAQPEG